MDSTFTRMVHIAALLAGVLLAGTTGFKLIEGWPLFDALYMSVTTITTVGFMEVHPLSTGGRIFVMFYLGIGLGMVTYSLFSIGEIVYRAKVRNWFARRTMDLAIQNMKGHFIICGLGRMGRTVCRYLADRGIPFVAVDRDEASLAECREQGWPWLAGDATDDDTLRTAGIDRARGLAAVLPTDADNVYVVLSARLLCKDLQIIARASEESSVTKLTKAGANRIVGLYDTGAAKMAQLLVNPNLADFIESFGSRDTGLELAEIQVSADAPYVGKTLQDTDLRERGVIVIAIRRAGGELLLPPPSTLPIEVGDCLIVVGRRPGIASVLGNGQATVPVTSPSNPNRHA